MTKRYLGDGAYYEFDGYGVSLTTENGIETTNRVYLETEVIVMLVKALATDYDPARLRALIEDRPNKESEEPIYIDDGVQLSNKACPHHYSLVNVAKGTITPDKQCGCPPDRCWYHEQKARRAAGKKAISPKHWLTVVD